MRRSGGWAIHSVYTKKNSIRPPVISLEYSTSIGHIFTRPAAKFSMQTLQGRGLTGCHSSPLLMPFPILRVVIPSPCLIAQRRKKGNSGQSCVREYPSIVTVPGVRNLYIASIYQQIGIEERSGYSGKDLRVDTFFTLVCGRRKFQVSKCSS